MLFERFDQHRGVTLVNDPMWLDGVLTATRHRVGRVRSGHHHGWALSQDKRTLELVGDDSILGVGTLRLLVV